VRTHLHLTQFEGVAVVREVRRNLGLGADTIAKTTGRRSIMPMS
jgi:hypothetical protein